MQNFKVRVAENIGEESVDTFGSVGTILKVTYGVLTDLNGYVWDNAIDRDCYESVEDLNNHFSFGDEYQTVFEAVEEGDTCG
jgi:hypothetical protein